MLSKDFIETAKIYQQLMFDAIETQLMSISIKDNSLINLTASVVENVLGHNICCCFSFKLNNKQYTNTVKLCENWEWTHILDITAKQDLIIQKLTEVIAKQIAIKTVLEINEQL